MSVCMYYGNKSLVQACLNAHMAVGICTRALLLEGESNLGKEKKRNTVVFIEVDLEFSGDLSFHSLLHTSNLTSLIVVVYYHSEDCFKKTKIINRQQTRLAARRPSQDLVSLELPSPDFIIFLDHCQQIYIQQHC